jgi:peptidyl-prolyl cis-trans isomerase B (cyclophilin B)
MKKESSMKHLFCSLLLPFCLILAFAAPTQAQDKAPRVIMETSHGNIVIELDPQAAPLTTANFIAYVENGFYEGTLFHRVIKGFMIQGGGLTSDMRPKATQAPVVNEADNGLKNDVGTIAMARTQDPHSATAQFFINVADNTSLNHTRKTSAGWGYCVFGRVVEGMEVVRAIEKVATTSRAGHRDVPAETVLIKRAAMVADPDAKADGDG